MKNKVDKQGNIYPKDILEKMVSTINDGIFGCIGHENSNIINLSKISHKCNNAVLTENYIELDLEILNTFEGNLLKNIINDNSIFGCRGFGTIKNNIIQNDYKLISIDLIR